ncbi:hypothetical protein [Roseovarius marisflavi]|nr:hypothetical protein [Roseovarius marisflavi]
MQIPKNEKAFELIPAATKEALAALACLRTFSVSLAFLPKGPIKLIHKKTALENMRLCLHGINEIPPDFVVHDESVEDQFDLDRFYEIGATLEVAHLLWSSSIRLLRLYKSSGRENLLTLSVKRAAQGIATATFSVGENEEQSLLSYSSNVAEELFQLALDDLDEVHKYGVKARLKKPVWPDENNTNWSKYLMLSARATFEGYEQETYWDIWVEWYQGFLDGNPMDWGLQRRVALIDDATWEAGPEAVAEEIERIRAKLLAEKAPQAERVEFNPDTAKFFTVPVEIAKPDLLGATLSQVSDALEDVLASPSNGLHGNAREVRVLRRVFTKYGNDPQQIEMSFVSVHRGLTRQILNDELPPSEENLALQTAVEEGARAIRATHADIAENRKILNEQVIRELPEGGKETLEDALPMLVAISEAGLAEEWQHDIPQLINDATLPLPSGAPPLPGADEATRIFSRVAKIALHLKAAEVVHRIDQGAAYKATAIALMLRELVKLGFGLF